MSKTLLSVCVNAFLAIILGLPSIGLAEPNQELHRLFEDYWSHKMKSDPFGATLSGVHDFNDRVPDVSQDAIRKKQETLIRFYEELDSFDMDALDKSDSLSLDILKFILKHDIELGKFDTWRIPFLSDSGFHNYFGHVVSATPFNTKEDYETYFIRLESYPEYLRQNLSNMRVGLADDFSQPKDILEKILPSFDAQVTKEPEHHPLYRPLTDLPDSIDRASQNALTKKARQILVEKVIPACAELARFMREEYIINARTTLGANQMPGGDAYYTAWARYFSSLDASDPVKIHALGIKEVKRIRSEMNGIIKQLEFKGSFQEFLAFLRSDRQFYPKTPEELLMKASWLAKRADGRLPAFFGRLPRQPYSVQPVPDELAPNYTGGRYSPAPPGASRGGEYWVNTYALETRSLYQLTALTLHEAVPGHHLQIALAYEIENAPQFRKKFYPHAYGEGWALYSEKLGVEMGLYDTPYDHFGRLSYEMWRACRLVVDTGIHSQGWTRQQAIDYLVANTALSYHTIGTEIDRYIAWPGQALSYKMGELTILELRSEAEQELGDQFDIREFHDTVLAQGGLPLDLLRKQVMDYIDKAKAAE